MPGVAQRSTVIGQFDATPAAIEQSYAKGVFEIGYRLGNYRLRNRKMGGGTAIVPAFATAMKTWRSRSLRRDPTRSLQGISHTLLPMTRSNNKNIRL